MRYVRLLDALLALAALSALSAREFTSKDGQSLEGDIMGVANGMAAIRGQNGRQFQVPLANLSAEDQLFADDWWEENGKYALSFECKPKSVGKKSSDEKYAPIAPGGSSSFGTKMTTQEWCYQVTVRNSNQAQVPPSKMAYFLFVQPDTAVSGQSRASPRITTTAEESIPPLKPGETYVFETKAVVIGTYRPPEGYRFSNGAAGYHKDQLAGMAARISNGKKLVWLHETHMGLLLLANRSSITDEYKKKAGTKPFTGPIGRALPDIGGPVK